MKSSLRWAQAAWVKCIALPTQNSGRDVALKVLSAELAHDVERLARFRREAKVLAQLDHPNIVTIYSVEESEGIHFLTMQLVEGQSLDRLISQNGLAGDQTGRAPLHEMSEKYLASDIS